MNAAASILALMTGPLGSAFGGQTWATWRAVLKAAFALSLTDDEREVIVGLTQRTTFPTSPVRELWLLLGRRSGKSIIAALIAVWATCCRSYTLAPGEVGIFMVIAADRKQARVIKRYISGLLRAHPALEALIDHETADAITLTNRLVIEIHTCSFRSLRGYTVIGAAVDEVAFWDDEDAANPDREVLIALRAAMASVPEAMLVALTSVYARRGEVWRIFEKHFGRNESADVLVVNGPTRTFNPLIDERIIAAAYEDDPIAAAAEYGAEFRRDVERFATLDAVEAVTMPGRTEQPYQTSQQYVAFLDAAGGSGKDSMTLAIAHMEQRGKRDLAVLDAVREVAPPFSPEAVVQDFATVLRRYRITRATSDRYAGSWPVEAFSKTGIVVEPSARAKSELYRDLLPLLTSQRVELLDNPRLKKQLLALERRTTRGGREQIAEPPNQHDDVVNAVAGALVSVLVDGIEVPLALVDTDAMSDDDDANVDDFEEAPGAADEAPALTEPAPWFASWAAHAAQQATAVRAEASVAAAQPSVVARIASAIIEPVTSRWSALTRRPPSHVTVTRPADEERARAVLARKQQQELEKRKRADAEALADEIERKAAISRGIQKRLDRDGWIFPSDDRGGDDW